MSAHLSSPDRYADRKKMTNQNNIFINASIFGMYIFLIVCMLPKVTGDEIIDIHNAINRDVLRKLGKKALA
jgi:hypothetical protein